MGITRFTLVLAVMALLFALPGMVLADEPPVPSVFGGTATLDGAPAPDGTTVSALIDGTVVAATTVENGAYAFTIPQPPDESYSGKTVTFLIGGATAAETGIWEAEGGGVLNLSASGGQIPQVTAEQTPQDPVVILLDGGTAANGPKRKAFVGVVEGDPFLNDVLADSVTISQKGNKGEITISLANPDIKIKKPGGPRVRGTFSDGARVVIQARNEDDGWVAIRVLVKPVKPTNPAFTGTVLEVADGVITIMHPDGSTKQVELEAGTTPPAIGELVTGFAGPAGDDGEGGANKPAKAKGLVKASKIRARLEGFLQELTTDTGDLPEAAAEAKAKVKAAQGKAEAARTKVDTARTKAKAARTKAETAQGADAAEVEELAADAEEEAAEAVADQAEAEAELAEAEAEAAAEAAEAEAEAADRRAQQVADVAAILNSHTNKHLKLLENLSKEDLPAQAKAGMEKALANAQRGRSVATLKAAEARAKTEDKTLKALAKAEEKRVEALARTEEKRVKALARVEEKKDRALARAEEKKDRALVRAEEKRVQALAKPEGERGNALAKAEEEKGRALAKAEEEKENALAKAEEELQKAQAEQDREAAQAQAERDREAAQGPGNSQGKGRSR